MGVDEEEEKGTYMLSLKEGKGMGNLTDAFYLAQGQVKIGPLHGLLSN